MLTLLRPRRFPLPPLTFPQILGITTHNFNSAATSHHVPMPAAVNSGELLLLLMLSVSPSSGNYATAVGWVQKLTAQGGPASSGHYAAYSILARVADGSEGGGNINFATALISTAAAHLFRVRRWYGDIAAGIATANSMEFATSSHNLPQLTPPWGSSKTLWIASTASGEDDETAIAFPAAFANQHTTATGGGTNNGGAISSCTRELEVASIDPGTITLGGQEYGVPATIAIRPRA